MNIIAKTIEQLRRLTADRKQCKNCELTLTTDNFRTGRNKCQRCERSARLARYYASKQREVIHG